MTQIRRAMNNKRFTILRAGVLLSVLAASSFDNAVVAAGAQMLDEDYRAWIINQFNL
jgi:hypothetical protein